MTSPTDVIRLSGVYYVETKVSGINPIAIRPEIRSDSIAWEDTGHGRTLKYALVFFDGKEVTSPFYTPKHSPQQVDVITQKGDIHLVKLTKKIFDENLKNRVGCGGSLNFSDDAEVQQHYLKTDFGY
jgi:hypothetical protein